MPRRIGLLGGTFNPIHLGHLHIASEVRKRLELSQILFIPVNTPPHKNPADIVSAKHRMRMVELALSDYPQFIPCDIEIKRSGISYSIDTVQALKEEYPDDRIFYILGIDAFSEIETWKSPEVLLSMCDFVILSRKGSTFSSLPAIEEFKTIDRIALGQLDTGGRAEYVVSAIPGTTFYFLNIPPAHISASEIRKDIRSQTWTKKRLPHAVESYIIYHNLYREDNNS